MKKLIIIKKDNFLYTLKDKNNKEYIFNLEFQDIDIILNSNDNIYFSENLLNKNYNEYSTTYTFGPLDSTYGRNIDNENNPDIIRVDTKEKTIYLKRLYG